MRSRVVTGAFALLLFLPTTLASAGGQCAMDGMAVASTCCCDSDREQHEGDVDASLEPTCCCEAAPTAPDQQAPTAVTGSSDFELISAPATSVPQHQPLAHPGIVLIPERARGPPRSHTLLSQRTLLIR